MRRLLPTLLIVAACATGPGPVELPSGVAARGRKAFAALFCYTCHTVEGESFERPTIEDPQRIGESWDHRTLSDGELVTAIINPDHDLPEVYKARRMLDYSGVMTVQQLVDLVALLREVNRGALARRR